MENSVKKDWPRNLDIDRKKHPLYKELSEHDIFKNYTAPMKEVFMYAMALGYYNKQYYPLERRDNPIPVGTLTDEQKWLIYSIALSERKDNPFILLDIDKVVDIAEQYANGGITDLYNLIMHPEQGDILNELDNQVMNIIDQEIALPVHEDIEESIPDNKNIEDIIMKHENSNVEFKESLLWDTKKSQVNIQLAYVIARTIAGFLNSKNGGKLIIGISDQKEIKGIENDLQKSPLKHHNKDGFRLKIQEIITNYLSSNIISQFIHIDFKEINSTDICILTINKGPEATYVKNNNDLEFYLRRDNITQKLNIKEANQWIRLNWT